MNETGTELNFDRAEYANRPAARPPCDVCKKELGAQYWQWQQRVVCADCRGQIESALAKSRSSASFGKALLLGGGTAFGCGIAYAIFVGVTNFQFALVTIGIAFLVAKVIRKASGGLGGLRYQVLAVVLTYMAATMGYFPAIMKALTSGAKSESAQTTSSGSGAAPANDGKDHADDSTKNAAHDETVKPSLGAVFIALGIVVGYTLAAPFLEIFEAPIGMLIVIFGLWEAWKRTRGVPIVIDGPYNVARAPVASPAAG